jgi:hypothetical protein
MTNSTEHYAEDFTTGPAGWLRCDANGDDGGRPLVHTGESVRSESPWWVDYNHAPPGAGYLHLPFVLHTHLWANTPAAFVEAGGGSNSFVDGGFSRDFTDARLTVRIRGELAGGDERLVLLVQSRVGDHITGYLLTSRPLRVEREWSTQTVTLDPDPARWTCLAVRHDRAETYGTAPLADVLADVNVDIMLVLFPLDVRPLGDVTAEQMHLLRAGEECEVDRSLLPTGWIELGLVAIELGRPDPAMGS